MNERIVFDTEPLVAYLDDEPGSDVVEDWIDRIASGEMDGSISPVTKPRSSTSVLESGSVRTTFGGVSSDSRSWASTATIRETVGRRLRRSKRRSRWHYGDAYALATAEAVDGTLLVGADDDFDEVAADLERFRDEPV